MNRIKWWGLTGLFAAALILAVTLGQTRGLAAKEADSASGSGRGQYQYQVEVGGEVLGSFTRVSGLKMEVESIELVRGFECPAGSCLTDLNESLARLEEAWMAVEPMVEKAKHEIAMNSVRNMKFMAGGLGDPMEGFAKAAGIEKSDIKRGLINRLLDLEEVLLTVQRDISGSMDWGTSSRLSDPEQQVLEALRGTADAVGLLQADVQAESRTALTRKRPGRTTYANITLERALSGDAGPFVVQWKSTNLHKDRFDGTIVVRANGGKEIARYEFAGAWIAGYELQTEGQAIEKIEIAVEKVERAK